MEAIKPILLLVALAFAAYPAAADQPPAPLPALESAKLLNASSDQSDQLSQPAGLRGIKPKRGIKHAFSIDPRSLTAPPKGDASVHQASTNPKSPRAQALLTLFSEAERLTGRGKSVGDLTDLIERCGRARKKLDGQQNLDLNRLTSWACNRRGELRVAAGKHREAFSDFQQAIVLDPRNADALVNRGVTLAQYGKSGDALADFSRAIALNPKSTIALRNRAELHTQQGQFAKATGDYTAALTAGAADASLFAGRGYAHAQLGRYHHAAADYNEALRLAPGDSETLVLRGALYAELGYYEQSIADLDAALAIDPSCATAYQGVAWLLSTCPDARFRNSDKALEAARRAVRFGPQGDPVLLDVLAAAFADAGLMEEAVRVQQQALVLASGPQKRELQTRLNTYRQGRPYRQPPVKTAATRSPNAQTRR